MTTTGQYGQQGYVGNNGTNDSSSLTDHDFVIYNKPHGIPTTLGPQTSFVQHKKHLLTLGEDHEYGLVTRLDNDTAGAVLFAQTAQAYDRYRNKQSTDHITKHYLCRVYGSVPWLFARSRTPLAHHRDDKSKVVYQGQAQGHRGKRRTAQTYFERISYDPETHTTLLDAFITKGMRHQIRVHALSLGFPLINDRLYSPKKLRKKYDLPHHTLGLICVGYSSCDTLTFPW